MRLAGLLVCCACAAWPAHAQHFAAPLPPAGERGGPGLLEDAQPAVSGSLMVSAFETRWWGVPGLTTRALALGLGVRSLRVAAGLSQTGDPAIGVTTLAVGLGVASPLAGAGVRAASWSDRSAGDWSVARARAPEAAYEAGAGAWLSPASGVRVWASAPQLLGVGDALLERTLELGVRAGHDDAVWCTLRAPRPGDDGERALGAQLTLAPVALWVELRDAPLRSAAGLRVQWRGLQWAVRLDSHPVLGETVRSGLTWAALPEGAETP